MKTATSLMAAALLIGITATAQAQGMSNPGGTPGDQKGVERNPDGSIVGSQKPNAGGTGGAVQNPGSGGTTGSAAGQPAPNTQQRNPTYPDPSVRSGSSPAR